MLVSSGILQSSGMVMTVVALAIPEIEVRRMGSRMPTLGIAPGGVSATWSF